MEKFKIDINKETYLNLNPVEVNFKDKKFVIIFNKNFEENEQKKESENVFDEIFDQKTSIDPAIILENTKTTKNDITTITMKKMCLFKNTTLSDLINVIAAILQSKVSDLQLDLSELNMNANVPFQSFSNVICVGSRKLKFESKTNFIEDYGFYIDAFIEWYLKQCSYLTKLISEAEITKYEFDYNIFKFSIAFRTKRDVNVNLVRTFNNINSSKRFSRLIIHDDLLDTYNNVNHVQYVKNQNILDLTNKHVIPKTNILTLYTQTKIADSVVLECIDIFKDGSFKYNFCVSKNIDFSELMEYTDKYFDENLEKDFEELLINECSLTDTLKPITIADYEKVMSNISTMYMLENASSNTIKLIDQLFSFKGIESRFRSNTSININMYNFFNENTIHQINEDYKNHSIVTENNVRINIMPEMLFAFVDNFDGGVDNFEKPNEESLKELNDESLKEPIEESFKESQTKEPNKESNEESNKEQNKELNEEPTPEPQTQKPQKEPQTKEPNKEPQKESQLQQKLKKSKGTVNIQCNRFTDFEEIKFALAFTIPLFKIDVKNVESTGDPVEDILERLRNQSIKQNLKRLASEDPELFAPRTVSKNPRAYSALCQIKEQRPSVITESEYRLIHEKYPDSTFNIANQTNDKQRLYLVCPYEGFRFANYHHFNNQKCIVRCTTKMSNPGQYTQCAMDLDAEYVSGTKLTHQSAAIIRYNENLAVGRKCYLPKELANILPNIVCTRLEALCNSEELTSQFRRFYKALPLIIRRNSELNRYELLTEYDVHSDFDYILVIEPESKPKYKYICVDIDNNNPFLISTSKPFTEFLTRIYKINKTFDIIQDYVKKVVVKEEVNEVSMIKYFEKLALKKNIKLVVNNEIVVGIVKNKVFYSMPQIPWPLRSADICLKSSTVYKNIRDGIFKIPTIEELLKSLNDYDFEIVCEKIDDKQMITGIYLTILNTDLIIPCQITQYTNIISQSIKYLDTNAWLKTTLSEDRLIEIRLVDFLNVKKRFDKLISLLLQRFIKIHPEPWKLENPKDKFIEFIGKITDGFVDKTEIVYIHNLVSVFKSKLNKKDLLDYFETSGFSFKMVDLSNIIYKTVIEEYTLPRLPNEIITQKQFS